MAVTLVDWTAEGSTERQRERCDNGEKGKERVYCGARWHRIGERELSSGVVFVNFSTQTGRIVKEPEKNGALSRGNGLQPGKKVRSKPQLARYLGNTMDLSSYDFCAGKTLMSKLNRNRQRLHYDKNSQMKKGKPDLNTSLPVRQTASIFKQPVTKVTNHPSNKVKADSQKVNDQPRQKLSGLSAFDIAEELVKTMDLPQGLKSSDAAHLPSGVGPASSDTTLLSAIASALHNSSAPVTGQLSIAVDKNPGVWLNTTQPLCKAFMEAGGSGAQREEEAGGRIDGRYAGTRGGDLQRGGHMRGEGHRGQLVEVSGIGSIPYTSPGHTEPPAYPSATSHPLAALEPAPSAMKESSHNPTRNDL
ncbi:hypothetical protein JZ751_013612 [Albula glossodonta]|uniref:Uncharacterized protein n=1 Tax=Albula glossodonta TaxID=121402 RepID=A0A8T2P1C3_9TELE|nr:hypothetical protein JZ751_013612 [Albula glossodonta]